MSQTFRKVLVLGLDGLEPTFVDSLLKRGMLPNLSAMQARGGYARVATTAPAQTPVAWSTFATGTNPGGHGVFDFLRRDPATCLPDLALNRYEQKNTFTPPRAVNLRGGTPLWSILADAGVPATVLRCPCTYPPDAVRGRLLSGMGVPDLRGGFGTATYYTTAEGTVAGSSERVVRLQRRWGRANHHTTLRPPRPEGPLGTGAGTHDPPRADRGSCAAALPGRDARRVGATAGPVGPWVKLRFKLGFLQSVRGMVRFRLISPGPRPRVICITDQFEPASPLFPISHPGGYAGDLASEIGPYYTTGMVEDHAGLSNGRLDESAFLDQCALAWREREAMMLHELGRFDEGFFFCLFDTPDRVQHMFWRFLEPDHPANRGRPPGDEFAGGHRGALPTGRQGGQDRPGVRRRRDPGHRPQRSRLRFVSPLRGPEHLAVRARFARPARRASSRRRRRATCSAPWTGRGPGPTPSAWEGFI